MTSRSIQTTPRPASPVREHICEKCSSKDEKIAHLQNENEKLMEQVNDLLKKHKKERKK